MRVVSWRSIPARSRKRAGSGPATRCPSSRRANPSPAPSATRICRCDGSVGDAALLQGARDETRGLGLLDELLEVTLRCGARPRHARSLADHHEVARDHAQPRILPGGGVESVLDACDRIETPG